MRAWRQLAWLGPLVAVAGLVTYFSVFAFVPALRDTAALNLVLVFLGLCASVLGTVAVFHGPRGLLRRAASALGVMVAACSALLLHAYVFDLSSRLPAPTETTLSLDRAPAIGARDQDGNTVTLASLDGKNVVLVFYRGHW